MLPLITFRCLCHYITTLDNNWTELIGLLSNHSQCFPAFTEQVFLECLPWDKCYRYNSEQVTYDHCPHHACSLVTEYKKYTTHKEVLRKFNYIGFILIQMAEGDLILTDWLEKGSWSRKEVNFESYIPFRMWRICSVSLPTWDIPVFFVHLW